MHRKVGVNHENFLPAIKIQRFSDFDQLHGVVILTYLFLVGTTFDLDRTPTFN